METPDLQAAPKIDPVDVALLVIFQAFLSALPNIILSFFSFGKVPLWWAMWLIAIVNLKFSGTAVNAGNLELLNKVSLVTRSAHLAAAILLIVIVRTITRRHEEIA